MEFVPLLVLGALVKKTIDWLRVLIPDDIEAKILIPLSGLIGVIMVFLFSLSPELSGKIEIWSGQSLARASIALVVVYGLGVGMGIAGVLHDFVKPHTPPHDAENVEFRSVNVPHGERGQVDTRTLAVAAIIISMVVLLIILI